MPNVLTMDPQGKIGESLRRSLPLLPGEARTQVEALLTPASLAIVSDTLLLWGGSHFWRFATFAVKKSGDGSLRWRGATALQCYSKYNLY